MNLKILENPVFKKYNEKELEKLLIHFVQFIEFTEKKENKEEQVILHQIDFKDLTKKEQEAYLDYKKNKNKMKFYNL